MIIDNDNSIRLNEGEVRKQNQGGWVLNGWMQCMVPEKLAANLS